MRGAVDVSPKISVVIPSYNYAKYLRQSVKSAAEQSGVDHEVVIVENGSTDGSPEIARSLASEYPNVRLVSFATNEGIISSMRVWRSALCRRFVDIRISCSVVRLYGLPSECWSGFWACR
jgi:glycosyltransferase involved in cell wall biosynthesis